jgi:DNA-binding NarL/FixJ family response regulator
MRIRVVVASDLPIYGAGLAAALSEDDAIDVVQSPVCVGRLPSTVRALAPDVAVCALERGHEVDAILESLAGNAVVVVGDGEPTHVARAARAGARGYVRRGDAEHRVRDAVITVAAGRSTYPDREVRGDGEGGVRLTPRELDLVALIAACASNKEIARTLGIAEQTVKNQLGHLMVKVGVSSRLQLYKWAADHGIATSVPSRVVDLRARAVDAAS